MAERLKSKQYRAKLVRRVYIPKENGKERPIGIPALEDKLVQLACAKLLNAIYLQYGVYGYVAEADICGFFDHLDHDKLLEMLRLRIDDRAFLGLIRQWLKAGVLETDGQVIHPQTGSPQGSLCKALHNPPYA